MTQLDTSLPAVLRRRAKRLEPEHGATFVTVFLAAADELAVRQRCARTNHTGRSA